MSAKCEDSEHVGKVNIFKYNTLLVERVKLYTRIKDLEDKFVKLGQNDQPIFLNKPKEIKFYNSMEGLSFDNPHYLRKVISFIPPVYNKDYIGQCLMKKKKLRI